MMNLNTMSNGKGVFGSLDDAKAYVKVLRETKQKKLVAPKVEVSSNKPSGIQVGASWNLGGTSYLLSTIGEDGSLVFTKEKEK